MEAINLFVRSNPVLRDALEELVRTETIKSSRIRLESGEYLFREDEDIRQTFYISRGLVRLSSNSPDGYSKTVFFHRAGTLIGFQGFQAKEDQKLAILNAKATSTCELYAFDALAFSEYLKKNGEVCYAMAQYLFEMLALQTRESVNASVYPVLQRFAALLLALARELNMPQAPAMVPFSNGELAEMLGVHPNSITNSINALRKAECVEKQRNTLVIIDFKKLKSVAENLISHEG